MLSSWLVAAAGGAMIGAAAALLLAAHGQIAGISGISGALLRRTTRGRGWRLAFLGGLAAAGLAAHGVAPATIGPPIRSLPLVIAAGLLVGYGTRLGNGCTSGHGVCGLGRGSARSLVAVATFMTTGILTAVIAGGAR
jgi:uncharacterized membrane protein YedE/YeeE